MDTRKLSERSVQRLNFDLLHFARLSSPGRLCVLVCVNLAY